MGVSEKLYERLARLAPSALRIAAPFSDKLERGLAGRRGAMGRLEVWARDNVRLGAPPVIWMHAPSVGEALMAKAILAELRIGHDLQCVFTHFSPSAERVAETVGADVATYLPWDTPDAMGRVLAILEPAALVFVRTEIWPVLVRLATGQGRPTLLVNAVLSEGSSRLRGPARAFLHDAYVRLDAVGAVSADDAARFPALGVQAGRVHVTGDARFDQVEARVKGTDRSEALLDRLRSGAFTVLGGSTWPADEERLVPAFASLDPDGARLIIAPHEPTEPHLAGLEKRLDAAAIRHARLSAVESGAEPLAAIVVDRVGVLADLYAIADVAWIGGGFGRDGLHSVVEPAAFGVPVLCGPRHGNAQEAKALAAEGGATIVADTNAAGEALRSMRSDPAARTIAGTAARTFVESRLGGARNNAQLIGRFLAR